MARESALWKRVKDAGKVLASRGTPIMLTRIENTADQGTPDVDGCVNGEQIWLELKSCKRPARAATPIRPKLRESQTEWMGERVAAGCRRCWFLIQVGEGHQARLYLIRGCWADQIIAPEDELDLMSAISSDATVPDVLVRASLGW